MAFISDLVLIPAKADQQKKPKTDSGSEEPIDNKPQRQRRHTKTPHGTSVARATQLQYYPGQWVDVLTKAKALNRLHLVTNNAFPLVDQGHKVTADVVTVAMDEHEREGGEVEAGQSPFLMMAIDSLICSRIL